MNNILVVNVNWLGDVIFSSPVFRALKLAYPQARITCMAVPRVRQILESVPDIDEVIIYDEKGGHWGVFGKLRLVLALRKMRFDMAIHLHRSWTRALLVFLAGIPRRIGYDEKGRGSFLTDRISPPDQLMHRSDRYSSILKAAGIPVEDRENRLKVDNNAKEQVDRLLRSHDIFDSDFLVVINPGGNWELKRWPPENYSRLIFGFLVYMNAKVVITGEQKDVDLNRKVKGLSLNLAVDLTGKTDLLQVIALMKRADLVVSADSGPLHIANAVGTDVVGLFGPTRPELTGPRGAGRAYILQHDVGCNRRACYHLQCRDNVCMRAITVHDVKNTIEQIRNT